MIEVPGVTPNVVPVLVPTVATAVLLLAHVPPPEAESGVDANWHTVSVPEMGGGDAMTVTTVVAEQPPTV